MRAIELGAVWSVVRDFNALPKWTPFVAESRIEQNAPADKIGCVRNFRLKNGGRIRERLRAASDERTGARQPGWEIGGLKIVRMGQYLQHAEHQFELIGLPLNEFVELARNRQSGAAIGTVRAVPGPGDVGRA